MTVEQAEGYQTSKLNLAGSDVEVTSYKIGDRYYCHVSNVDPGATIARAEGASREDAEQLASMKAARRLGGTPT